MDPNANLKEQRELAREAMAIFDKADPETVEYTAKQEGRMVEIAERLAELVQALDEWISKGGFLPQAWAAGVAKGGRVVCSNPGVWDLDAPRRAAERAVEVAKQTCVHGLYAESCAECLGL